jgi:hypothetical protein
MPGKPYQSVLIPYEKEIIILRRRRPPMPYAQIADLLRQEHGLVIQPPAIYKFLKVRSRSNKVFRYGRNVGIEKPTPAVPARKAANPRTSSPAKPVFDFTYSERYNLKRLPPEEAAAIRKKLEEEGH